MLLCDQDARGTEIVWDAGMFCGEPAAGTKVGPALHAARTLTDKRTPASLEANFKIHPFQKFKSIRLLRRLKAIRPHHHAVRYWAPPLRLLCVRFTNGPAVRYHGPGIVDWNGHVVPKTRVDDSSSDSAWNAKAATSAPNGRSAAACRKISTAPRTAHTHGRRRGVVRRLGQRRIPRAGVSAPPTCSPSPSSAARPAPANPERQKAQVVTVGHTIK